MEKEKFKLLFYLKRGTQDKNGKSPIMGRRTLYGTVQLQMLMYSSLVGQSQEPTAGQECRSRIGKQGT